MKLLKYILPLLVFNPNATANVLSVHCPFGCPENPKNNDLIFAHIYALSNNPNTKFADWVAYEVNQTNFGVSTGRIWKKDPLLDADETLEQADYKGANRSVLEADRGHQVPLASFTGSQYWYEANYLSNITPQNKDLNQGAWKNLESAVRNATSYKKPLYVITGPLFNEVMPSLPKADEPHVVPSGYFKIIYDHSGSVSFLMKQSSKRNDDYCSKIVSLSDIQNKISYKLPMLKENKKIKTSLGCE